MSLPDRLALLEALLFVSDRPLAAKELAEFLGDTDTSGVDAALQELGEHHASRDGGFKIEKIAGGFRLATRPDHGDAIKEFFRFKNRHKLSRAALETLAIIAYRQPATHPEIQEIRGVSSDSALRTLVERRLVKIAGRKDTVGKPLLYGTTRQFLEHFRLGSLDDLPPMDELEHLLVAVEDADPAGDVTSPPAGDHASPTSPPEPAPLRAVPTPVAATSPFPETDPA
ncbi:MAG: SMC-Scp complex subunit ScpB [Acidobacteriota bacterium]